MDVKYSLLGICVNLEKIQLLWFECLQIDGASIIKRQYGRLIKSFSDVIQPARTYFTEHTVIPLWMCHCWLIVLTGCTFNVFYPLHRRYAQRTPASAFPSVPQCGRLQ